MLFHHLLEPSLEFGITAAALLYVLKAAALLYALKESRAGCWGGL